MNVRQKMKKKSFLGLITNIVWSGPHSYKRAKNCLDILMTRVYIHLTRPREKWSLAVGWCVYIGPSILSKNELKNYRHVSNASFSSKILDKVISHSWKFISRITIHLSHYNQLTRNIILQNQRCFRQRSPYYINKSTLRLVWNDCSDSNLVFFLFEK